MASDKRIRRRAKTTRYNRMSGSIYDDPPSKWDNLYWSKWLGQAAELASDAKDSIKGGDYSGAGYRFLQAAYFAARDDPRTAAHYATQAEKNFKKYQFESHKKGEQVDHIYKEIERAKEDAKALRHKAARRKVKGIESHVVAAIFSAIGVAGLFFLSPNLTGNVIGNASINTSNVIGAVLFFVGIIGLFFTFKRNK